MKACSRAPERLFADYSGYGSPSLPTSQTGEELWLWVKHFNVRSALLQLGRRRYPIPWQGNTHLVRFLLHP